ncbi:ChuX/HutX family heme-like substrate-binding protein [Yoonia sp. BS5-3]|uniref:Hemin-degrading factor n=1 Tax=Yoonia phaeophyticola TaxID=3137369 RepID=A0ABZ2V0I9_9RHOB
MAIDAALSPDEIRQHIADNPKKRARDLADQLGVGEAALVAAQGATRIHASPDAIMPGLKPVGEVMALTRNISAVHEKTGIYDNYHSGDHASMILTEEIDLRIFSRHWVHGFAVTTETERGPRHSLQVFDAAGDAIHKIYAREGTDMDAWRHLVSELTTGEVADHVALEPRVPAETPKADPEKADVLRKEWAAMTDTHQFMRLTSKLRMNRLGAYRIAGAPFATALAPCALNDALEALAAQDTQVMLFVGNKGCIQIHSGPVNTLRPMGPWQNIMDPGFNLHLRNDHVAEVWAIEKPTKRGPAISIEAFDKDGALILQMFGRRKESDKIDYTGAYKAIIDGLPTLETEEA